MTLLQTLGRRIQQHCCKPSAVEPRHCYGFSAMIPFCGTFPKDSKSTALGLLGICKYVIDINLYALFRYSYGCLCVHLQAKNGPDIHLTTGSTRTMAQGNLSPFEHVSHGQTKTAINWGGIPTITDWWFGTMEFYDFPFSCSYGHLLVITG